MTIIATGIDLAKNVFAVHGVNDAGKVELRQPKVARAKLNALVAALPPSVLGMEACSGAHYWARLFQSHGHTVKLMASKLVGHSEDANEPPDPSLVGSGRADLDADEGGCAWQDSGVVYPRFGGGVAELALLVHPVAPTRTECGLHNEPAQQGGQRPCSACVGCTNGCRRRCPILGGEGRQKDPRQMPWGLRCLPAVEVGVMPCAARCAGLRTRPGRPGSRRCRSARRRARGSWRCGRWSRRAG